MKNAAFLFAGWFLSLNPAEQWPQLLPSPVVVQIQSSTPLLESLTSNKTALPSWPDCLREHRWTKQEIKRVGSGRKTIWETVFILQTVQQSPFHIMELSSEQKCRCKSLHCPRITRMNFKNIPLRDVKVECFVVLKISGVSTMSPEWSNRVVNIL